MNFGETYHYTDNEERKIDELVDTGVATYEDARQMLGIQADVIPTWAEEIAASLPIGGEDEVAPDREYDWAERAAGEAVRHSWGD
jgi:hypothetical protein